MSDSYHFVECAACAAKTGSPTLCPSCISNRTIIYRLQHMTPMQFIEWAEANLSHPLVAAFLRKHTAITIVS